jgi:hypothetical protein
MSGPLDHGERERLRALEVEMGHLSAELRETREAVHRLNNQVATFNELLQQGKGVSLVFRILFALGGVGLVLNAAEILKTLLSFTKQ